MTVPEPLDALWSRLYREDYSRLMATLVRRFGDLDLAEDVAQEAMIAAWETWPRDGAPAQPLAWLTTVARNRALDRIRSDAAAAARLARLHILEAQSSAPPADQLLGDDQYPDDRLAMLMGCCHPALAPADRLALMLRFVGGLTTAEVAAALLVTVPTMQARLTRAKKRIHATGIPLRAPDDPEERARRVPLVLQAISSVFTEGYAATSGDHPLRADLVAEAIRLGRIVRRLLPRDPEPAGLLALLLLTDARSPARVDDDGLPVPLEEQDRTRWRAAQIAEAIPLVSWAVAQPGAGRWSIQAAIAAVHAESARFEETDWGQIVVLYDLLHERDPSPVVRLGRAVAVGRRDGFRRGIALLDELAAEPELQRHAPYHLARAITLAELGRPDEAQAAYQAGLELVDNDGERRLIARRLAELGADAGPGRPGRRLGSRPRPPAGPPASAPSR